jgi:uncharacterized protein (TIGR03790 family)
MRRILPALILGLLGFVQLLSGSAAMAQHGPNEVLVVYNADSPVSRAIAKYYMSKRHIRTSVAVHCADSALSSASETISFADYTRLIAGPVGTFLAAHGTINFIVLTKGVPIRIDGALTGEYSQPSVDSYLAAIDYPAPSSAVKASLAGSGTVGTGWINHYYNSNEPFSHKKFNGYLVTRLDGYTEADAIRLVDESLASDRSHAAGTILLDVEPDFGMQNKDSRPLATPATTVSAEEPYWTWNADMLHAADILHAKGVACDADVTTVFAGGEVDLLGYFSWGSNDDHFNAAAYESLRFAPGSICDTAVSTSARTFLPASGGQTLMADLISHGVTCCQGYVGEPILDGISSPTIDLSHYVGGYTMAESFYAGTPYIGWEGICIGDPLCRFPGTSRSTLHGKF